MAEKPFSSTVITFDGQLWHQKDKLKIKLAYGQDLREQKICGPVTRNESFLALKAF